MKTTPRPLGIAAASIIATLAGCYVEDGNARAPAPAPVETVETEPVEPGPITRTSQGGSGGSAYGAAKRSATSTTDKLAERQRELERQLEDPP